MRTIYLSHLAALLVGMVLGIAVSAGLDHVGSEPFVTSHSCDHSLEVCP